MALAEPRLAIATPRPREGLAEVIARQGAGLWIVAALLLAMPLIASPFWLVQIFAYSMILGMIALSLMFLAGYGGIVSLVQMTVAAFAAYLVAIFGDSAITQISLKWPWWTAVPVAVLLATLFGTLGGALSVRTEGIYTIMITLAIGSAFYYLTLQNYTIFNGFSGFNGVMPPVFLGIDWGGTVPFYYLALGWAALAYAAVVYVSRAPFGLALQGTRDNPRRMAALGFDVVAHRIAA
jgi:branched-chain amino acid transport system permease protein